MTGEGGWSRVCVSPQRPAPDHACVAGATPTDVGGMAARDAHESSLGHCRHRTRHHSCLGKSYTPSVVDALRCPDIAAALPLSANSDSKLILLVGDKPLALREAGDAAAADLGWRGVRLNLELGRALREYMPEERPEVAWDLLLEAVGEHDEGAVLIGTDLLWEPSLHYDPYRSLRRLGRHGPLIATWFGRVEGQDITRAQPGHPDYTRDRLDVPYVVVQ